MSKTVQIYVNLLGEAIEVWRPVKAEHVQGNVYRIVDQPYDRGIESWQFEPGDQVVCDMLEASDGRILAAKKNALHLRHEISPGKQG